MLSWAVWLDSMSNFELSRASFREELGVLEQELTKETEREKFLLALRSPVEKMNQRQAAESGVSANSVDTRKSPPIKREVKPFGLYAIFFIAEMFRAKPKLSVWCETYKALSPKVFLL